MYIYIHIYIYIYSTYTHIYEYIFGQRERESERDRVQGLRSNLRFYPQLQCIGPSLGFQYREFFYGLGSIVGI